MHHVTVNPVAIVYLSSVFLNDFIQERNDSYCSLHTAGVSVACYVPLAAKAASVMAFISSSLPLNSLYSYAVVVQSDA